MQQLFMVLLLSGSAVAFAQPSEPDQVLFDTAAHDEMSGKFERARLELVTLANTYAASPLAAKAKSEVSALDLFLDARQKQETGNARSAQLAYRTVAQVYPESPLAPQAEATSKALDPQSKAAPVRSLAYRGFPVSQKEIQQRFEEREVLLAVERAYDADEMERARKVLVQLLADKGHGELDVKAVVEEIPPHSMGITFTAAKK